MTKNVRVGAAVEGCANRLPGRLPLIYLFAPVCGFEPPAHLSVIIRIASIVRLFTGKKRRPTALPVVSTAMPTSLQLNKYKYVSIIIIIQCVPAFSGELSPSRVTRWGPFLVLGATCGNRTRPHPMPQSLACSQ